MIPKGKHQVFIKIYIFTFFALMGSYPGKSGRTRTAPSKPQSRPSNSTMRCLLTFSRNRNDKISNETEENEEKQKTESLKVTDGTVSLNAHSELLNEAPLTEVPTMEETLEVADSHVSSPKQHVPAEADDFSVERCEEVNANSNVLQLEERILELEQTQMLLLARVAATDGFEEYMSAFAASREHVAELKKALEAETKAKEQLAVDVRTLLLELETERRKLEDVRLENTKYKDQVDTLLNEEVMAREIRMLKSFRERRKQSCASYTEEENFDIYFSNMEKVMYNLDVLTENVLHGKLPILSQSTRRR